MQPIASIIIPCGPKHAPYLPQALASCQWQTVGEWEAIVINDTGSPLDVPPQVRVLPGRRNVSANRNAGIAAAAAPFILCLDADDYLLPTALETFLRGYTEHDAGYVYSDCYTLEDGQAVPHAERNYARAPDYEQQRLALLNLHTVTALVPTECARAVGGFDERVNIWEDWSLWLRLAQAGVCGQRLPVPTFVYRLTLGDRRSTGLAGGDTEQRHLMDQVLRWYRDDKGQITMCGCNKSGAARTVAAIVREGPTMTTDDSAVIKLEYIGSQPGSQTFRLRDGRTYRGGNNNRDRYAYVQPEHKDEMLSRFGNLWRVALDAPPVPPPDLGQVDDSEVPEVVFTPAESLVEDVQAEPDAVVPARRGPGRPRKDVADAH